MINMSANHDHENCKQIKLKKKHMLEADIVEQ